MYVIVYVYEYGYYDVGGIKTPGPRTHSTSDRTSPLTPPVIHVASANGIVGGLIGKDTPESLPASAEIPPSPPSLTIHGTVVTVTHKNNKS